MRRCSYESCLKRPSFNVQGSKGGLYCRQHAVDGMVDVCNRRCPTDSCNRRPNFNVKGSKAGAYCKEHAHDGMIDIVRRRCSHDCCTISASYSVEGNKTATYCKKHAGADMFDVRSKRCLHASCTTWPSFNIEGSTSGAYCSRHREEGMVYSRRVSRHSEEDMVDSRETNSLRDTCSSADPAFNIEATRTVAQCKPPAHRGIVFILNRRCLHDSCTTSPAFNIEGRKTAEYCGQHARSGMVCVVNRRVSRGAPTSLPSLGVPTDSAATAGSRYTSDFGKNHDINFQPKCQVAGCGKEPRWGLHGKRPTHCAQHGSGADDLDYTVGEPPQKKYRSPSLCTLGRAAPRVKTECTF